MKNIEKKIILTATIFITFFMSTILNYATDPEVPYIIHTLIGTVGGIIIGYLTGDLE